MKLQELPQDMCETVTELAKQFPFPADEIVPYFLIGGEHTAELLKLKLDGASDQIIGMANQDLWDAKNNKQCTNSTIFYMIIVLIEEYSSN